MTELQFGGVKKIAARISIFPGKLSELGFAVNTIANDGMPDGTQVHTNLVRTTRHDFHFDQRKTGEFFEHAISAPRRPAFRGVCGHSRSNCGVTADVQIDFSAMSQPAVHQSD